MTAISPELRDIAERYIELESMVNEAVTDVCRPVCRECVDCCCQIRFCTESVESHWLRTIASVSGHCVGELDGRYGWLAPQGCRLKVGRPPVCYEFFCGAILRGETNPYRRYALNVLGRLVGFVGARAIGSRHLVTLTSMEIQARLRPERVRKRLDTAEEVFRVCREVLRTGDGCVDRLKLVLIPPREISVLDRH